MHPKGADSMATSGLGLEKPLVGARWAIPPLHKRAEKTGLSPRKATISGSKAFPCLDRRWSTRAVTIEFPLMGMCGQSL